MIHEDIEMQENVVYYEQMEGQLRVDKEADVIWKVVGEVIGMILGLKIAGFAILIGNLQMCLSSRFFELKMSKLAF